jgi:hypothetical protein
MEVGLLSSASALALVGYTGTVIFHGNLIALLDQLAKDKAFLAWMASAGIIYYLSQQPSIGGPVRLITGVAILAVLLKIFSANTLNAAFGDFAAGKLSLASLFAIFGVQAGKGLGIYNGPANSTSTLPNGVKP